MVAIIVDIVVSIDKLEGCRNKDLEVAGAAYLLGRIKKLLAAIIDPYLVDQDLVVGIEDLRLVATIADITCSFEAEASSFMGDTGSMDYIAVGT